MARSARGSLSAAHESDSRRCCRSLEEVHAADGSGSCLSYTQERAGHPAAISSAGKAGEGTCAGSVSWLCAAGNTQAFTQAQWFGVFTGTSREATLRTVQRRHRATNSRRTRDLAAQDYQAGRRSGKATQPTPTGVAGTIGADSNPEM